MKEYLIFKRESLVFFLINFIYNQENIVTPRTRPFPHKKKKNKKKPIISIHENNMHICLLLLDISSILTVFKHLF